MTALVIAASAAAYAMMALALARHYPWPAPLAATAVGLAWVGVHALRPRAPVHGLFFVLALAGAGVAARDGTDSTLLGLGIVSLVLVAWDLATMRRTLLQLPARLKGLWGRRYALQSVAVASLGVALSIVGLIVRPHIGFPAALGLSLSIVTLLILTLWQSGRFRGEPKRRPVEEEDEEAGKT